MGARRRCKTCNAEQGDLDAWCGACGAATPIPREEEPREGELGHVPLKTVKKKKRDVS
jgi:hypothetical protein